MLVPCCSTAAGKRALPESRFPPLGRKQVPARFCRRWSGATPSCGGSARPARSRTATDACWFSCSFPNQVPNAGSRRISSSAAMLGCRRGSATGPAPASFWRAKARRAMPSWACGRSRFMASCGRTSPRRSRRSAAASRSSRARCCRSGKAEPPSSSISAGAGRKNSWSRLPSATSAALRRRGSRRPGCRAARSVSGGSSSKGAGRGSKPRIRSRSRFWSAIEIGAGVQAFAHENRRREAPWRSVAGSLALALVLAGCAASGRFDPQVVAALPEPAKQAEASPAAQREHQRILAAYGGTYQDARVEALIAKTVERLVAASERPDLHYSVTLLNSASVNAFALANDNAELASVLAHEMAHVIARHAAIREDQVKQAALVSRVATDVFNDPQMGALALATFSRAQELEADGIGVGISSRAGFDPYGAVRFLNALGRNAELKPQSGSSADPRSLDFLSSHPATPERVKITQANARQYSAPGSGERDRAAYLASIDGLVYGEDPSEGFVRGRRFIHPRLGFTFLAPSGFVLDNTAQAVLGVNQGGGEALRLDVVQVPVEQSLADYLASGWIENIDHGSIESTSINGFPAATAIARGEEWTFRLYALRFGSDVYRFIFASKQQSPEIDRAFRDAVASFRRMTLAEIETARPLRLKIVTVKPGDTPEHLAARMAIPDRALDRFLVLNGLQPGQALKSGEQVKLVVE